MSGDARSHAPAPTSDVPTAPAPSWGPVTAVIVHRNRPESCVATGRALLDQGVDRLVVVDNGSPRAALDVVRAGLAAAHVIELGCNSGFGPGANAGLRHWLAEDAEVAGHWVLVCPHDARPDPGCVPNLLAAASSRSGAGLASAEYGDGDGHGRLARPVVDRFFGGILGPTDRRPGWEDADHPHGTLLLASRACLEDIGLFDERYFAYCEEADLGLRATAAGWGVGVVWGAVVRNPSMSSETGVPEYLMLRNSLHLVRRNFGRYPAFIRFTMALWTTVAGVAHPSRQTPFWHLQGRVLALRDFLLGRDGPPPASLLRSPARRREGPRQPALEVPVFALGGRSQRGGLACRWGRRSRSTRASRTRGRRAS